MLMVWAVALIGGTLGLAAYSSRPGSGTSAGGPWPNDSRVAKHDQLPTLVMFLHPKCSCSVATLRELQRCLSTRKDSVSLHIGFYCPSEKSDSWAATKLRSQAERIAPGSTFVDRKAREARRFGAVTSGHLIAFSPDGTCLFSGGITSSRAHEGSNSGADAIRQILSRKRPKTRTTPIFGCPIVRDSRESS